MRTEEPLPEAGALPDDALLRVDGLHVHYRQAGWKARRAGTVRAVDNVSFALRPGETTGLVGESGSGKSSFAKALVRLERAVAGQVWFEGADLLALSSREMRSTRRHIQMVFQDSLNALNPRHTVAQTLAEPLLVHQLASRSEARVRAAELASMVGIGPELLSRYPGQLSGGQRQRVNIARALAPGPSLIIADEPTSALDVSVQAQILNLLRELQASTGITMLFISHDLSVVRRVSRRVAVMYLGQIVEEGPRNEIYSSPRHPYTRALLEAAPHPDPRRERARKQAPIPGDVPSAGAPPSGCRFHPRCRLARDMCAATPPPLRLVADGHLAACHFADDLSAISGGERKTRQE